MEPDKDEERWGELSLEEIWGEFPLEEQPKFIDLCCKLAGVIQLKRKLNLGSAIRDGFEEDARRLREEIEQLLAEAEISDLQEAMRIIDEACEYPSVYHVSQKITDHVRASIEEREKKEKRQRRLKRVGKVD